MNWVMSTLDKIGNGGDRGNGIFRISMWGISFLAAALMSILGYIGHDVESKMDTLVAFAATYTEHSKSQDGEISNLQSDDRSLWQKVQDNADRISRLQGQEGVKP